MKILFPILLTIIYHLNRIDAEIPRFRRRGSERIGGGRTGMLPQLQNPPRNSPTLLQKKWAINKSLPSHHYQKMMPGGYSITNQNRYKTNPQQLNQRIGIPRIGNRMPQGTTKIPNHQFNYHQNKFLQQPPQMVHKNIKNGAAPPYNNFNKKTTVKFPQDTPLTKKILVPKQEMPLPKQVLPPAPIAEHDIHIQTNSIPITSIKQTGEFGPIHTIPAPKLGPADKSNHFELKKKELRQQQEMEYHKSQIYHNTPIKYTQQPHHYQQHDYQVTEQNELSSNRYPVYSESDDQQDVSSSQHIQSIPYSHNKLEESYQNSPVKYYQPNTAKTQTQAILSSFIQQQPQLLPHQIPYGGTAEDERSYISKQIRTDMDIDADDDDDNDDNDNNNENDEEKRINPPEFHSFNYDEQAHQAQINSGANNFVSATYSLGSGIDTIQRKSDVILDPLTQSRIVQNYFDPRIKEEIQQQNNENGEEQNNLPTNILLNSSFFNTLPNKKAAERLAQLQIAGRVNSNLMQLASNKKSNPISDSENVDDTVNQTELEDEDVKKEPENQYKNTENMNSEYDEYIEEEPIESDEEIDADRIEDQ